MMPKNKWTQWLKRKQDKAESYQEDSQQTQEHAAAKTARPGSSLRSNSKKSSKKSSSKMFNHTLACANYNIVEIRVPSTGSLGCLIKKTEPPHELKPLSIHQPNCSQIYHMDQHAWGRQLGLKENDWFLQDSSGNMLANHDTILDRVRSADRPLHLYVARKKEHRPQENRALFASILKHTSMSTFVGLLCSVADAPAGELDEATGKTNMHFALLRESPGIWAGADHRETTKMPKAPTKLPTANAVHGTTAIPDSKSTLLAQKRKFSRNERPRQRRKLAKNVVKLEGKTGELLSATIPHGGYYQQFSPYPPLRMTLPLEHQIYLPSYQQYGVPPQYPQLSFRYHQSSYRQSPSPPICMRFPWEHNPYAVICHNYGTPPQHPQLSSQCHLPSYHPSSSRSSDNGSRSTTRHEMAADEAYALRYKKAQHTGSDKSRDGKRWGQYLESVYKDL